MTNLQLEVEGDRIIVLMPGTSLRATYLKSQDPRDQRQLVESLAMSLVESLAMSVDKEAPVPRKEFETKAWEAATAKARELGWIV